MSGVPLQVTPSVIGALLLLLRELLPEWKGLPQTVDAIVDLAGAKKSQAYAMRDRLRELLPTLIGTPGRPVSPPSDQTARETVLAAVLEYCFSNPGAVCGAGERRVYSDDFRTFVVGLAADGQPGAGMSTVELASVCGIPLGTLKDWMHPQATSTQKPACDTNEHGIEQPEVPPAAPPVAEKFPNIRDPHVQLIVAEWQKWKGPFSAFCEMLRTEHRIPYCATFIGSCLQSLGLRHRKRRRPVEAPWSGDTFRSLFPGAQWLGDGTSIAVRWADQLFVFNVEALLDVASNGVVGFHVSNSENEEALRLAHEMGRETTGSSALFISLDNRPSNHSPGTIEALGETVVLPSTPGRGQAKAPLEGAFGLFQQAMPPVVVEGNTMREMARCVLELVMTAWWRGRNGKPRKRLNGRTPIEEYRNARPTQEELDAAMAWLRELQRRRDEARRTREARRDPVRLELLTRGLAELGISDPDRRLAITLAYYSREAIIRGLSTFRAKLESGTLPSAADPGRYLGGIIRQLDTRIELERISVYLLEQRIRLNDITLAPLTQHAERLRAETPVHSLPQVFLDHALAATWEVDFRYWAKAAAEALSALPGSQRSALYRALSRRVAASFKTARERRDDLIDRLAHAAVLTA